MLANQTDRVYCDIEDLRYAVTALEKASNECSDVASGALELKDSLASLTDSAVYTGAAIALDIIATMRVGNATDFKVIFDRMAFEKYTEFKKKGITNEEA